MNWLDAVLLGIIEGITEFLPISSTGHLTIAEQLMGYDINDPAITAFTAIIQIGAILAAVLYFRNDILRVARAWMVGLFKKKARKNSDYKYGWAIIIGSVPIAVVGLVFQDEIETTLRSMWWIAIGLIGWSIVLYFADRYGKNSRIEKDVSWKDTLIMGLVQCMALIPGVSRSGATMSAGLLRNIDRVTVTRLSFFLGIPALTAAGIFQAISKYEDIGTLGVGWPQTIAATVVSFIVGYLAIAWLLKFIAKNNFTVFIWYRLALGVGIMAFLVFG